MAKRKAKKAKKSRNECGPLAYDNDREHRSVSLRKIDNGYLSEHTRSGGGKPYESRTIYHAKKPKFDFTEAKTPKLTKAAVKRLEKAKL